MIHFILCTHWTNIKWTATAFVQPWPSASPIVCGLRVTQMDRCSSIMSDLIARSHFAKRDIRTHDVQNIIFHFCIKFSLNFNREINLGARTHTKNTSSMWSRAHLAKRPIAETRNGLVLCIFLYLYQVSKTWKIHWKSCWIVLEFFDLPHAHNCIFFWIINSSSVFTISIHLMVDLK